LRALRRAIYLRRSGLLVRGRALPAADAAGPRGGVSLPGLSAVESASGASRAGVTAKSRFFARESFADA
jgi:hypothetical protein